MNPVRSFVAWLKRPARYDRLELFAMIGVALRIVVVVFGVFLLRNH
jgi:hypothetical protein